MSDEPTVYLVDEDPATLRTLTALVKSVFPRVEPFSSAADFLAAYRKGQPGCLVLDVAMPGMNGIESQRKSAQDTIPLPVVFVCGYGNVAMAVEAMRLGAVNFLEKPVQGQELWDSIREALVLDEQARQRLARRKQAEERLARLSSGEYEVVRLILEGKRNREIATELGLSTRTIEDRRAKLMAKMNAHSLAELVQMVITH